MGDPDIADLLLNLDGLDDLFSGANDWLKDFKAASEASCVATSWSSGSAQESVQEQHEPSAAPPKDPPRKRGRPKGSKNATVALSAKQLQDQLVSKMAALEMLQQENELLHQHMSMLELVVQSRDEQLQRLKQILAGHPDDALTPLTISAKAMRELPLSQAAEGCKNLMSQVGGLLLQSELQGDRQPLETHMAFLQTSIKFSDLLRPDGLLLSGRDVTAIGDSVENAPLAPQSHWQGVVSQMELSPHQCRQAWVLSELYNRWHARLLADRAAISAQLSHQGGYGPARNSSNMPLMLTAPSETLMLEKLHASVVRERCLIVLVADVFRSRLLHDTQLAKHIVYSYPYCPDVIAILAVAAACHAPPTPLRTMSAPSVTTHPPATSHPPPSHVCPRQPTSLTAAQDLSGLVPPPSLAQASTNCNSRTS